MTKPLSRPGGHPPPTEAALGDGRSLALLGLAAEITERYALEFPDEDQHYSSEWREWCTHDNQFVLGWALDSQRGMVDLWEQISWLARVLDARGYPLDRLARSLELAADVLEEDFPPAAGAATALRAVAARVVSGEGLSAH